MIRLKGTIGYVDERVPRNAIGVKVLTVWYILEEKVFCML